MARRHLNQEQRRALVQAELKDRPEVSDRIIAKELGVSPTTVGTARKGLEYNGELSKLDSSIGADGKERPRQVERKAPEPELPIDPPASKPITLHVANPSQVTRTATKGQAVLEAAKGRPELSRVVENAID